MKLYIPVCISFDCQILEQFYTYPYVLVGCGGYHSDKMKFTDDTGNNVSKYNQYLSEMSLMYWMAKNYDLLGNPDYIGLAHYRRILKHEDWMLQPNSIVCSAENYKMSVYQSYCYYHVKSDIDFVLNIVKRDFPSMLPKLLDFCNQQWNFGRNIFIMHRDNFMQYSQFICKIIEVLINEMLPASDINQRDKYQKRAFSFLLERMTGFWIYYQMVSGKSVIVNTQMQTFSIDSPYQRP